MSKVSIRLSDEEEAALRAAAEASGVTVSDVIRGCIAEKFSQVSARMERENEALTVLRKGLTELEKGSEKIGQKVEEVGKSLDRKVKEIAGTLAQIASFLAKGDGREVPGQEVEKAVHAAQETRSEVEEMCRQLRWYCNEIAPKRMAQSLDEMSAVRIERALVPLDQSVGRVVHGIDRCSEDLSKLSWKWQLLVGPVIAGFLGIMIGVVLACWRFR